MLCPCRNRHNPRLKKLPAASPTCWHLSPVSSRRILGTTARCLTTSSPLRTNKRCAPAAYLNLQPISCPTVPFTRGRRLPALQFVDHSTASWKRNTEQPASPSVLPQKSRPSCRRAPLPHSSASPPTSVPVFSKPKLSAPRSKKLWPRCNRHRRRRVHPPPQKLHRFGASDSARLGCVSEPLNAEC